VLGRDHIVANQQDFRALLTKAKSLSPQAVFFGGTSSTGGGLIRRQMADTGLRAVPFIGGDGISDATFIQQAGEMADGTYYAVAAPDALKLPSARAFVTAYQKRFGAAPGPYSANAFAAAQVAIAGIEKGIAAENGGTPTRAEVLHAVAATRGLMTPIGPVGFDAHGDTTSPILTLVEIAGGKPQTVDQIVLPAS
jgi:branched-chain amino acid transport system substrate-binding protein